MDVQQYLSTFKEIQASVLLFIDNENNETENYTKINELIKQYKITNDSNDLRLFLRFISTIVSNHHRYPRFYDKIFKIFDMIKSNIFKSF